MRLLNIDQKILKIIKMKDGEKIYEINKMLAKEQEHFP